MKSRDFCYWLQGFFEIASVPLINGGITLSYDQVAMIKKHLDLVFVHEIDPQMGNQEHQDQLNAIHGDGLTKRC